MIPVFLEVLSFLYNIAVLHDIHVCYHIQQHLIVAAKALIDIHLTLMCKALLCCRNTEAGIYFLCLYCICIDILQTHDTFTGTAHEGDLFHISVQVSLLITAIASTLRILHAVIQTISLQSHGI